MADLGKRLKKRKMRTTARAERKDIKSKAKNQAAVNEGYRSQAGKSSSAANKVSQVRSSKKTKGPKRVSTSYTEGSTTNITKNKSTSTSSGATGGSARSNQSQKQKQNTNTRSGGSGSTSPKKEAPRVNPPKKAPVRDSGKDAIKGGAGGGSKGRYVSPGRKSGKDTIEGGAGGGFKGRYASPGKKSGKIIKDSGYNTGANAADKISKGYGMTRTITKKKKGGTVSDMKKAAASNKKRRTSPRGY